MPIIPASVSNQYSFLYTYIYRVVVPVTNVVRHIMDVVFNQNQKLKILQTTSSQRFYKGYNYYNYYKFTYYNREFDNIVGAIDWHSYSQLILRPYGNHHDNYNYLLCLL